jgi:hypothetical protein
MPPTAAPCDLAYTTALVAAGQRIWAAPDLAALWPTVVDEALALIAADGAAANCGLRRCTERDLSIVRPTFSGDVGDPYVRPRARHILRPRKRGSTALQDSGSSVGQRKPAS